MKLLNILTTTLIGTSILGNSQTQAQQWLKEVEQAGKGLAVKTAYDYKNDTNLINVERTNKVAYADKENGTTDRLTSYRSYDKDLGGSLIMVRKVETDDVDNKYIRNGVKSSPKVIKHSPLATKVIKNQARQAHKRSKLSK